jgi:ubiquinone/menaquinone biosynthesis C-methylase UbiE
MSAYDGAAASFDRHRAPPEEVPRKIRDAILVAVDATARPRLLDLGAGTGRIGWPFVAAGDDYVAADLSFAMLRRFAARAPTARLVQADGARLPFVDATFDAVMLVQVFAGLQDWPALLAEVRRVLRASGLLVLGHTSPPAQGIDAQMKQSLGAILEDMGLAHGVKNAREEIERWLDDAACGIRQVPATWESIRTPRDFLDRHRTGARFSALPEPAKQEALGRLAAWAVQTFGTLDAAFRETLCFELRLCRFHHGLGR